MERRELIFLEMLAFFVNAKTIVEVGVQRGDMAVHLCKAAHSNNGSYVGFDIWSTHGLKNQFNAVGSKESVSKLLIDNNFSCFQLIQIDTINSKELFEEKLDKLCPNGIDFAFIDACHSYLGISNDFFSVYPRLTDAGIIAFHDTVKIDGCREFVFDLRTKFYDGTFDLIDLPFGSGDRRCGVSILSKRSFPILPLGIDEICGSISNPRDIELKEVEWYEAETKNRAQTIRNCDANLILDKVGYYGSRKKFEGEIR